MMTDTDSMGQTPSLLEHFLVSKLFQRLIAAHEYLPCW